MEKDYVRSYLLTNGKYFPSNKLVNLGRILEESKTSGHDINKRFLSPVTMTILFWLFVPLQLIDRLILRDWFWGWLKIFLLPVWVVSLVLLLSRKSDRMSEFLYGGIDNIVDTLLVLIIIIYGIWTITDGFTIYRRTKKANYRAVLRALNISEENYVPQLSTTAKIASKASVEREDFATWKKKHPSSSINDFYRRR